MPVCAWRIIKCKIIRNFFGNVCRKVLLFFFMNPMFAGHASIDGVETPGWGLVWRAAYRMYVLRELQHALFMGVL